MIIERRSVQREASYQFASYQLATAYLVTLWQEKQGHTNTFPPHELIQEVVRSVMALGYTRKLVKELFEKWDVVNR